jgi:hypothetical protein
MSIWRSGIEDDAIAEFVSRGGRKVSDEERYASMFAKH